MRMRGGNPEDWGPYENHLDSHVWPGADKFVVVERDEMPPQYAAAALAKLVRWARVHPVGEIATLHGEDEREEYVRKTRLGAALAARACNLEEEHFHALYGEFGARKDADMHQVLAATAVLLQEGIGDWTLTQCIALGSALLQELSRSYEIKERL
jgi:hypothetical protein